MNKFYNVLVSIALLSLVVTSSFAQPAKAKAVPVFADGQAQVVPAFNNPSEWIKEDLWVETEFDTDGDGRLDRMHVDVTRPLQTRTEGLKLPVIYETSPYYAGTAGMAKGLFWSVRHNFGVKPPARVHPNVKRRGQRPVISRSQIKKWVPRGYIVVHSSSPGTGLSDGAPTVGGDNESLAPKAVIEWLTGKDNGYKSRTGDEKVMAFWSSGKVGMTGTSYNGTLPVAAATTGVKGLEAIIPIAPNTSYYHYYRSYGLVRNPGGYPGEDIDVLYDFIHSGDEAKRAYNNRVVRDTEMAQGIDRATGDYNDFWAGRDYLNDMKPFRAALLMSHGFNDWNVMPEHSYRIYEAARAKGLPTQIFYHQGGHGGPPPMKLMNRWFTRYLHGVENGVEKDPRAWIVREGQKRTNPTPYADYPHPDASEVELSIAAGSSTGGDLVTGKVARQGTATLVDDYNYSGAELAKSATSRNRLLFKTPVLTSPVHISGKAKIKIRVASSRPAANLSVWLVSLPWNEGGKITDNIITRGWADIQNYKSLRKSKPLKPGKFYEMTFELQPDDQIIPVGQQIGLMIFSSDKEFTLHPDPGTELTVDLDVTKLALPVVGGKIG
ncbi:MAG: Xaa-Pro dipeptidyl-peptidase [Pyrinomonadaceae bacterium]|nr:Xaa-Pro dipeptidyl-peptidase [Pyrinomonadaceae bacterium]